MKKLSLLVILTAMPFAYGMDGGAQSATEAISPEVRVITQFEYNGDEYRMEATEDGIFLNGNTVHQLLHKSSYTTTGPRSAVFDKATDWRVSEDMSQVALLLTDETAYIDTMMGINDEAGIETSTPEPKNKAREIIFFDLKTQKMRRKPAPFNHPEFNGVDPFAE